MSLIDLLQTMIIVLLLGTIYFQNKFNKNQLKINENLIFLFKNLLEIDENE